MDSARPAEPSDLAAVVELAREARAELAPMRGGAMWARREARPALDEEIYAALLDRSDVHVVVGLIDDVVVGFGVVTTEDLHDGRRLGVVPELFVTERARAVGVGEQMLELIVQWCADQGCIGVDTLALPGHRATKNFFEQSGFTARAIIMHRSLDE